MQVLHFPRIMSMASTSVWDRLPQDEQRYINEQADKLRLSSQYTRELTNAAADLHMWDGGPLAVLLDPIINACLTNRPKGTQTNARIMKAFRASMDHLRSSEFDYRSAVPHKPLHHKQVYVDQHTRDVTILGRCPVEGEQTRCCRLMTLDAVRQCGYGCSYCSIRSFYDEHRMYIYPDLPRRLKQLELDPERIYHIGTGQSSDSLMFGSRKGSLDALLEFAQAHPNVILELKTKSDHVQSLTARSSSIPSNVITTWSLNPQVIIDHEEHFTAPLHQRIKAARSVADAGGLVGFHFHPILKYRGWREDYQEIIEIVQRTFSPQETVMVSLGTLTFTRAVIRKLRESGIKTKVLRMPMDEIAGKYSYPLSVKLELFRHVYGCFAEEWKQQVYFYLCMEDPSLWQPVFGQSYEDNNAFESDMLTAYMHRISRHREFREAHARR